MAAVVDICIWLPSGWSADQTLMAAVHGLSQGGIRLYAWSRAHQYIGDYGERRLLGFTEMTSEALGHLIQQAESQSRQAEMGRDLPKQAFSIDGAGWVQFSQRETSEIEVGLQLKAQDRGFGLPSHNLALEPELAIRFYGLPSNAALASVEVTEDAVKPGSNVETVLRRIVTTLIHAFQPEKLLLLADSRYKFPMNASFASYSNLVGLTADCRFTAELAENGVPAYHVPSMKNWSADDIEEFFHSTTPPRDARRICKSLSADARLLKNVSPDTLVEKQQSNWLRNAGGDRWEVSKGGRILEGYLSEFMLRLCGHQ